ALPLLVGHPEHADRTHLDPTPREGGLPDEDEGVERVAVAGERVLDEAVVRRIPDGREQHPVEEDLSGRVIHLVLVPRAGGDLDDDGDRVRVVAPVHAPSLATVVGATITSD